MNTRINPGFVCPGLQYRQTTSDDLSIFEYNSIELDKSKSAHRFAREHVYM